MPKRFSGIIGRFLGSEKGSALVEMTLVTPVMIALSAGVFEFGNLFHQKLRIEAGLRDGARYAARCNESFYNPSVTPVIDCETNAKNLAVYGNIAGTGSVRVTGWMPDDVTVDSDYGTFAAVDADGNQIYRAEGPNVFVVQASTSFDYTGTSLLSYIGLNPITLSATHEERYIGW